MMQCTSLDPVEHWAGVSPERPAAQDLATGREWTYRDLDQEIQRVAYALAGQGIEFGDRVATIRRNSVSLIVLQHALLRLGAILVPLNWRLSARELALVLRDCRPKLLCVEEDAALPETPPGCRATRSADFPDAAEARTAPPGRAKPLLGDACVLLYTSGTSGTAKGVRLTARNLWATAAGRIRAKAGFVGRPGPLTSLRVVDARGADVGAGEPGEILVRGPSVTPGYWRPPPNGAELFTADGWLRTGDIGRRDGDGFVFLADRRSDVYISGGENVYPAEVEAVLLEHPAVQPAAVVDVPHAGWGEAGRAFVVTRPGRPVDGEALASHCRAALAGFKVPPGFVFRDALPQSGSGKVLRRMLRDA